MSWDAPTETPRDYRISWARVGDNFLTWTDTSSNAFPTSPSYTITGLDQGVRYKVRVRARFDGPPGSWSDIVEAVVASAAPTAIPTTTATDTPAPTATATSTSTTTPPQEIRQNQQVATTSETTATDGANGQESIGRTLPCHERRELAQRGAYRRLVWSYHRRDWSRNQDESLQQWVEWVDPGQNWTTSPNWNGCGCQETS